MQMDIQTQPQRTKNQQQKNQLKQVALRPSQIVAPALKKQILQRNDHDIAIAEKTILFLDRMTVTAEKFFSAN